MTAPERMIWKHVHQTVPTGSLGEESSGDGKRWAFFFLLLHAPVLFEFFFNFFH